MVLFSNSHRINISDLPFFLFWPLGVDRVPSSSSFGSFFISGFFSSAGPDIEDEDVSMGSPLHPSSNGFSFFICVSDSKHPKKLHSQCIHTLNICQVFYYLVNNVSRWTQEELASGFSSVFTSGWTFPFFRLPASWSSSSSSCFFTSILISSWLDSRLSPVVSWELGLALLLTEVGEDTWPSAVREGFGDSCSIKMDTVKSWTKVKI